MPIRHSNMEFPNMAFQKTMLLFGMPRIIIIFALVIAYATLSPAHAAERNYSIGSFDNIQIEGDLIVNVTTNKGPSASAIGTTSQLDALRFQRNGRTLKIQMNSDKQIKRKSDSSAPALQIFVSTAKLFDIFVNGNGLVNVNAVQGKKSLFTILGSGSINVENASLDTLKISIRGGGNVSLQGGKVNKADISLSGFGSITAPKLVTQKLDIEHQGPANSIISVEGLANITNNGSGSIEILGKANCLIKSIGSGKILCEKEKY